MKLSRAKRRTSSETVSRERELMLRGQSLWIQAHELCVNRPELATWIQETLQCMDKVLQIENEHEQKHD